MSAPGLAAITFDPRGGGVASVARLLRQVFRDQWGGRRRDFSLLGPRTDREPLRASTAERLRFGAAIATAQVLSRCSWMFYSHLSLARVQLLVPTPFQRPYAVFLHGVEVWRPLTHAERRILSGAALRIANSNLTARRVADLHPEVGPVVECPLALPAAMDPVDAPDARVPRARPRSNTVILVARMRQSERYKGHDELLKAWPAVRSRVPDARLLFVGDGDDVFRLRQKAVSLGVGESVEFTGFVSDDRLRELYETAAVFAMPSCGEGFGLVYLEAMSHRLPCIGSIHDAATEVIEDGVTGYLVEQSDIGTLVDRVSGLLLDERRRVEMGEQGFRRLQDRFTYAHFSRAIVDVVSATLDPAPLVARQASVAR